MSSSWTKHPAKAPTALKISKVHIRAFRATDDVNASIRFAEGHSEVLNNHGIKKVSSASIEWTNNPDVYVILATSPGGQKIYGGARIHIRRPGERLPLEKAFAKHDKGIYKVIDQFEPEGCAELCALWNSIEVAGLGIGSKLIINCAVSMTERLDIKHLLALSSPVTRRWIPDFGFYTITSIGQDGGIPYPMERLTATVAHFINPDRLEFMTPDLYEQAISLRLNPMLCSTATGPKGSLNLHFDLNVTR